jgi:acyl transferase domain-containing protein
MSERVFEKELSCRTDKVLRDHRVQGVHLFPGMACVHLALQHSRYRDYMPLDVRRVTFYSPIAIETSAVKKVFIHLVQDGDKERFAIKTSALDGLLISHVEGEIQPGQAIPKIQTDLEQIASRCEQTYHVSEYYKGLNKRGLAYGLYLQTISSLRYNEIEVWVRLSFLEKVKPKTEIPFHPSILDGAFQSVGVLFTDKSLSVPYCFERFSLFDHIGEICFCHGRLGDDNHPQSPVVKFDLVLHSEDGRVLAEIKKAVFKYISEKKDQNRVGDE